MALSELVYDHLTTPSLNLTNKILRGQNRACKYG